MSQIGVVGSNNNDIIAVLFSYSFFNVEEIQIPLKEFVRILNKEGFSRFAPRLRTETERFKSAIVPLEGTYKPWVTGGNSYWNVSNAEVTEASNSTLEVVILAAEINRKNQTTTKGEKVARVLYDKQAKNLTIVTQGRQLPWGLQDLADDLLPCPAFLEAKLGRLEDSIRQQNGMTSASQIRGAFDRIVHTLAIPTRTRGNWTFPIDSKDTALALERVADAVNAYIGSNNIRIGMLEIADTTINRKNMPEDAVEYAQNSFNSIFKELLKEAEEADCSTDPEKAFKKVLEKFQDQTDSLMDMFKLHEKTIGEKLEEIQQLKTDAENRLKVFGLKVTA